MGWGEGRLINFWLQVGGLYRKYIYRPRGKLYQCADEASNKKIKSNLTHAEHIAMEELAKRKDLIITNADKGGIVLIMGSNSYIKKANQ